MSYVGITINAPFSPLTDYLVFPVIYLLWRRLPFVLQNARVNTNNISSSCVLRVDCIKQTNINNVKKENSYYRFKKMLIYKCRLVKSAQLLCVWILAAYSHLLFMLLACIWPMIRADCVRSPSVAVPRAQVLRQRELRWQTRDHPLKHGRLLHLPHASDIEWIPEEWIKHPKGDKDQDKHSTYNASLFMRSLQERWWLCRRNRSKQSRARLPNILTWG